jgi:catechol 2,3-dioxygenase-like lactoylglutathione lyase family enzyme
MDIEIFDHVAINVTDLERSAQWYKRVLGFKIVHKWTTTWMVGNEKMRIGLFHRPKATPVEDLDNKLAITHFAFLTDAKGFERVQKKLKRLKVPFDPPEDTGIAFSIFFHDPDGYELEVTTYHERPRKVEGSGPVNRPCRSDG